MSQYRVRQEWRSPVHGGGSAAFGFDSEQEAIDFVDEPMPSGIYLREAQVRDGNRWRTLYKRDRRKKVTG